MIRTFSKYVAMILVFALLVPANVYAKSQNADISDEKGSTLQSKELKGLPEEADSLDNSQDYSVQNMKSTQANTNKSGKVVLNKKGTYTGINAKDILINHSGITLKDSVIEGNVFINEGAGKGEVILDQVTVKGTVVVGSSGSINLSGNIASVKVKSSKKPDVKLMKGSIDKLILDHGASLHVEEGTVIHEVAIGFTGQIFVTGTGKINSNDDRIVRVDNETPAPTFTNVSVHDPSVIKDGETYYVFGSHIEAAKSNDLMNWTTFTNGYTTPNNVLFGNLADNLKESFAWAGENDSDSKGGFSVWAPDVIWNENYINEDHTKGAYMMYYSTSSTYIRSAIGYAVSQNIEGPYEYVDTIVYSGFTKNDSKDADSQINKKWTNTNIQTLVDNKLLSGPNENWFKSDGSFDNSMYPNAIDSTLFYDTNGKLWMTYGSWSGGIFLLELDPQTGAAIYPGEDGTTEDGRLIDRYFGTKIAGGYTKSGEGPFIVYDEETGYYFLNVTYGWLGADGGYNMRQFRSKNPEGPYVDAEGKNAVLPSNTENETYGIKMIGNFLFKREIGDPGTGTGYGYVSAGHNSVYYDEETGKHFLFFHARFPQKGEAHELRVHQMYMSKDGWPVVATNRYAGETVAKVKAEDITGEYKFVNHGLAYSGAITNSVDIRLNQDHTISGAVTGSWSLTDDYYAEITVDGVKYDGVFVKEWNETLQRETMTFTAISKAGETIWGIGQPYKTDQEVVNDVSQALTLGNTSNVSANLTLPAIGARNTQISWKTSDASVVSETGEVNPPEVGEPNLTATLTATITKGSAEVTKNFTIVVAPVDISYGLSAQYSFENDLSASYGSFGEGSITGNRIDNTGGTITYDKGVTGNAAIFDGNSGIKLPNGLIEGNEYSVSMWLNPSQITQYSTTFFGGSNNSWISFVPQAGDNTTTLWSGENWYNASIGSRIRTNQWQHIAFSVDNGFVKVFINGKEAYSGSGFPDVFTSKEGVFSLGVNFWDTPYKGMIDELRIYNVAIPEQVAAKLAEDLPEREQTAAELTAEFSFEGNLTDSKGSFGAGSVVGDKISNPDGGTITYEDGVKGKAAAFDGKSGVLLPKGLISNDSYSVSMWVYADELKPYSTAFFGAQSNNSWISMLPMGHDGAKNNVMLWSGEAWYDAITDVKTPLQKWTHYAFTVDGDTVSVYVDGVMKYSGKGFPDIFTDNNGTFSLGVNWWDTPFKGMIDELQIYKGALTSEEVAELVS